MIGHGVERRSGPASPQSQASRVLVVDDERGIREGCRRILTAEGLGVEVAADARQGLRKLCRGLYDVILVDLRMPLMSGLEFLSAARRVDPDAVSVVITGYASYDTAVAATKQGAFDFLAKPFSPDELLAKVARAGEHRKALLAARRALEEADSRLLELDAERGRLRTVVDCMIDGVLVVNREGTLVLANPAAVALLGLGRADPVGRALSETLAYRDLLGAVAQSLKGTYRKLTMTSIEMALPPEVSGGQARAVTANIAPVRDAERQVLGAVAVLRDVTRLREMDRAKSHFISLVSHELKAPLGAVRTYLDLIRDGLVASPEQERQLLRRSSERIDSLLGLVDDLLDLSRIESGRLARRLEPVEVVAVVREVARLLSAQATEKGIVVEDRLPETLPPVQADRGELEVVFTNLISNAVKYNRSGGTIRLSGGAEGTGLSIVVADTGIGIPPEDLPKIFEEFHRVRTPETREIVGTGLGLAIAKRLVEATHGRIGVRSEPGTGSTFEVWLPIGHPSQGAG